MLSNEDYHKIFHEIKNSVTLIGSSLQLVSQKHPEVCAFGYWNEAMSEIGSLKNIVTQLSSARLSGQLNLARINIYSYMRQMEASVRALSWERFDCTVEMDDDLPLAEIDPQLMRQAILNIIKNAYEATGGSGTAAVTVSQEGGLLRISVKDNGGGLDPAMEGKLFQPFLTTKSGGSGLGLTITRQIAELHGGTLTYVSRPGDGCTFTISFPPTQRRDKELP